LTLPQTKIAAIHDLNLAASYGSQVSVMRDGSIVASGPTWETLTAELIAEVFGVEATAHHDRGSMALLLRPTKVKREVWTGVPSLSVAGASSQDARSPSGPPEGD
jgi:ABC-type cobalamin/Fe3+-siderophores transport system ATPase subunit